MQNLVPIARFCLSYLAHSMLYVNKLSVNGTEEQWARLLPSACDGTKVCAMAMSEAGAGTDVLGMSTKAVVLPAVPPLFVFSPPAFGVCRLDVE